MTDKTTKQRPWCCPISPEFNDLLSAYGETLHNIELDAYRSALKRSGGGFSDVKEHPHD